MRTDTFDYDLPSGLIAQDPLEERDASRLLVLNRATGDVSHRVFHDLGDLLEKGDCLVVNSTRVLPARLAGRKRDAGGAVELLLLERVEGERWKAMTRGAALSRGTRITFGEETLEATVVEGPSHGVVTVDLSAPGGDVGRAIDEIGRVPLPPYITHELSDPERYQTVYAHNEVSAAAPTAGLHFTDSLLERLSLKGVDLAKLELAVGMDTFVPVREAEVEDHRIHAEWFSLDEECARKVAAARRRGGRVVAVGTTSVRALESCASGGLVRPASGHTDLFITPGYSFEVVDALITNFHFPRSTLLMLVCAFAGTERVLAAYREAVRERYRFYSFGDAMLVA